MPCLYEITYLPWKDNTNNKPFLYSGSDWNDDDSYLGSVSSKEWKTFWVNETKHHPERFQKDIIMQWTSNEITAIQLREMESAWQTEEDHAGSHMYFNKSNRLGGQVSEHGRASQVFPPRTQEQKDKMKNKIWINNPKTQKNKRVDSELLSQWLNDGWLEGRGTFKPHNAETITIDGITYSSLVDAAKALDTNPESLRIRIRNNKPAKPKKRGSWQAKPIIIDGVLYESKKKASEMLNTTSLTYWINTGKVTVEYPKEN